MKTIKVKINGIQVEAEFETIRKLLTSTQNHAQQERATAVRGNLSDNPAYDGRAPHKHPHKGSSKTRTMKSSQKLWKTEEDAKLFAHFPLSRESTPPISKIKKVLDEFPGRSADAIQVRWYTLKKNQSHEDL